MHIRKIAWPAVIFVNGLFVLLVFHPFRKAPLYDFSGPAEASVIVPLEPTPLARYDSGSTSRLAILVTDPHSTWLGLAHGLKTIGVPFVVTTDYRRALQHKVIFVYPTFSGGVLSPEALQALLAFPQSGGTLIAQNAIGAAMLDLFGFDEPVPSRTRLTMTLAERQPGGLMFDSMERTIRLGNSSRMAEVLGSYGFTNPREPPLAVYDDGTAALIQRSAGKGKAYALGLDFGDYLLRGENVRADWLSRSYINEYEPAGDTLLRWLRAVIQDADPDAVSLGTVPFGRDFTLILTHDIDARNSLENSLSYARFEASRGVRATYFIQAKYLKDWYDIPLLDDRSAGLLAGLDALGMEIASHSVTHSIVFELFPLGTGTERYPGYHPRIRKQNSTAGASVLGELRVSKFLLEQIGKREVESFRSGYLRNPETLSQALYATGYRFSSTATVGETMTNLPFQMNFNRRIFAELPMFEFPAAVDDTRPIPLDEVLAKFDTLIGLISRYGGMCVVLIHPNVIEPKLGFEQKLLDAAGNRAWIGSVRDFGRWWTARNVVGLDVVKTDQGRIVNLTLPEEIEGLPVVVPSGWIFERSEPEGTAAVVAPGTLVLGKVSGGLRLFFRVAGPKRPSR